MKKELDAVRDQIAAKRGYLRFLSARETDPKPLLREIDRHYKHIAEHEAAIERIEKVLENLPAAAAKAQAELKILKERQAALSGRSTSRDTTAEKIAKLTAQIAKLKEMVK